MARSVGVVRRRDVKHVLIADDHPIYRDALRAVMPHVLPGSEIEEARSQSDVCAAVASNREFALVLLDLKMPGVTGMSCLSAIRQAAPRTPIVVISGIDDPKVVRAVIRQGARAFVPKSAPRQVLIDALRNAISRSAELSTGVNAGVHAKDACIRREFANPNEGLTRREYVVVLLLSQGKSNREIAGSLGISECTVKTHVSAVFRKLGVTNRTQAMLKASRVLSGTQSE